MKIPLYLQSLNEFSAALVTLPLVNPAHFVARVVFCFGNKEATTETLSPDCVPGTNNVTRIFSKVPRKLRDGIGSTWPLQFPSDRLWLEASITSPAPPLNTLPSDRPWFQPSKASPNSPFRIGSRSKYARVLDGYNTEKTRNPLRGSAAEAPTTKTSAEEPAEARRRKT